MDAWNKLGKDVIEKSFKAFALNLKIDGWKDFSIHCFKQDQPCAVELVMRSFNGNYMCWKIAPLNHYSPVSLFYTPWKHQKTFSFSDVFRWYRKATPGCNGLMQIYLAN